MIALIAAAQITKATAVPQYETVTASEPFRVAVKVDLEDGWHSYWLNAGDSGSAPEFAWTLPRGWKVVGPLMPTPHVIDLEGMRNYGYEGHAYAFFTFFPAQGAQGSYKISATSSWMVCKDTCKMVEKPLSFSVKVGSRRADHAQWPEYASILDQIPSPRRDWTFSARRSGDHILLRIGAPMQLAKGTYFFCEDMGVVRHNGAQELESDERGQTLSIPVSEFSRGEIKRIRGVISSPGVEPSVKIDVVVRSK